MVGQVRKIVEVKLHFQAAVLEAAKQNVRRDYLKGILTVEALNKLTGAKRGEYMAYARRVLMETGKNDIPEAPEYRHIVVDNWFVKKEE